MRFIHSHRIEAPQFNPVMRIILKNRAHFQISVCFQSCHLFRNGMSGNESNCMYDRKLSLGANESRYILAMLRLSVSLCVGCVSELIN